MLLHMTLKTLVRIMRSLFTVRNSSCGKVIFTGVCLSVHITQEEEQTPPGRHPLGRHPLPKWATVADGTHLTGMHSSFNFMLENTISEAVFRNSIERIELAVGSKLWFSPVDRPSWLRIHDFLGGVGGASLKELKSWGHFPIIMVRKRSLGKVNTFKSICHSASRGRGLPTGGSASRGRRHPGSASGKAEPPPPNQKSVQYAPYWNAFLFGITFVENCMK